MIQVPEATVTSVELIIYQENGRKDVLLMTNEGEQYQIDYTCQQGKGLYFYYFKINQGNDALFYGSQSTGGGAGQIYTVEQQVQPYQLTCYDKAESTPSWYREAVVYQIFPDRFFNGNPDGKVNHPKKNSFIYGSYEDAPFYVKDAQGDIVRWDFQGGNLLGIIKKIPYLKELGVTVIYLNPIFEAISNHRYDTGNYLKIDPILGDEATFKELITILHQNEMQLILDGVFNHVGRESIYFSGNGEDGLPKGATISKESPYYSWFTFLKYPGEYKSWWGFKDLPEVNKENLAFQQFIYGEQESVLTKWNELAVDGWRLDVADELPDFFLEGIRRNLEGYSDKVLLGEVWEDASNKISYGKRRQYILGNSLQGVMNYPFREAILALLNQTKSTEELAVMLTTLQENYPKDVFYNNLNNLGTHDTERILTLLGENLQKLTLAVSLLMMLPGIPSVYYGDEAGSTGGKDPDNRKFYPWGNENQQIMAIFQQWIARRRQSEPLKYGEFSLFYTEKLFGILRYTKTAFSLCVINPTDQPLAITWEAIEWLSDQPLAASVLKNSLENVTIPPWEAFYLEGDY